MTIAYDTWLKNQQQRRFYLGYGKAVELSEPLFDLPLSERQKQDGVVGYWPEYPVDVERKTWRVSPIFSSASTALSWLTQAAATWRSPFCGRVDQYSTEYGSTDEHDGSIGFELSDRYGDQAFAGDIASSPLSTVVFRGQRDARHGLIPTLFRVFKDPAISPAEAMRQFRSQIERTKRFTNKFFTDPKTLAAMRALEGPDLASLGIPSRAATARHYGYQSQFIDFSADVGVAAYFATAGPPPQGDVGSLWFFDEAYVERIFSDKAVMRTPRFEHRFLFQDSAGQLRSKLADVEGSGRYNWGGPSDVWDALRGLKPVQPGGSRWLPEIVLSPVAVSISLFFSPGPAIPRMNAQAWCALEMNTHLGWNKGTQGEMLAMHLLLERLCGRVNFLHGEIPYSRKQRVDLDVPRIFQYEISDRAIYPKGDLVKQAVEHYQASQEARHSGIWRLFDWQWITGSGRS
jgi:hypothetical protein